MGSVQQYFLFIMVFCPIVLFGQTNTEDVIAYWSFDNINSKGQIVEEISGEYNVISNCFKINDGIQGKSLKLDGYTTKISSNALNINGFEVFSIEAWVALQTYPWNKSPIVNQGKVSMMNLLDNGTDFFFGIDAYGHLVFELSLEDSLYSCVSPEALPLLYWNHVVASFSSRDGIKIYANGILMSRLKTKGVLKTTEESELWLGMNLNKLGPIGSERKASENILSEMVLDGLIDEVKIYNRNLELSEVSENYKANRPIEARMLDYHRLPSGPENFRNEFRAFYTRLNYTEEWEDSWRVDEFPDILVHFDKTPVRFVFWRGTSYGGAWITENGIWMGDQSLERVGKGKSPLGCAEHMSDKQTRYSQVRIIENNDARIVIHWRYAISDIKYNIFGAENTTDWGEWADEYYYIYPDGISTRYQILHTDHLSHEWQETIVINQAGTKPEDNIQLEAMTLANIQGETQTYSWEESPPESFSNLDNINIQMVNLKSNYRPFIIFEQGVRIKPFKGAIRPEYSKFPWWNHWPVAQIPNDGRRAFATDRPSHSSLSQAIEDSDVIHKSAKGSYWAVSLTGMTDLPIQNLIPLSKSWNMPPIFKALSDNIVLPEYSKKERAYIIESSSIKNGKFKFALMGSTSNPIYNPVFIVKNCDMTHPVLRINGKQATQGEDFRVGNSIVDYNPAMILWFNLESDDTLEFYIE